MEEKNNHTTPASEQEQPADKNNAYWNKWYAAVMLFLFIQIIMYYGITIYFKQSI